MNYRSIKLMLLFSKDNFIYLDLSSVELETAEQFFKELDELEFKWDDETLASQLLKKFWDSGKFKNRILTLWVRNRRFTFTQSKFNNLYKLNPHGTLKALK